MCFSHLTGAIVLLKTRINRSNRGTKIDLWCLRSLNARDKLFSDIVFALSEEPYFCRSLKQGKTVLKWICQGCLVHYFCKIRFLMRYELNVNEEITPNRQNHSFLLPNRIYLPSIKSNGYNKMDFEKQSGKH